MSKKRTNGKFIETLLVLDNDFVNINQCIDHRLTAPDGNYIDHKLNLDNKLKGFLIELGVSIEDITVSRVTRQYNIGGVPMEFESPNKLIYISPTEPIANTRYYSTLKENGVSGIKEDLKIRGYTIISSSCTTKTLDEIEEAHPCIKSAKLDTYLQ